MTTGSPSTTSGDSVVRAASVDVTLNGIPIVRGATLDIAKGEVVAILGNNGSGKTTLMRALMGLIPHHGEIEVFGTPLARFRDWVRIGYVPQRGSILVQQATAREVVASGRLGHRRFFLPESAADRRAIADALAEVGLADKATYPFVRLSGGQQQRILIARALATGADLMVWDEPAGRGRPEHPGAARRGGRGSRPKGTTIVMVLHELGAFRNLIDRTIVLADGRVMPTGLQPPRPRAPRRDHDHRAVHGGHEVDETERPRTHRTGLEVG